MITVSALRTALNNPAAHFCHLKNIKWSEEHITLSTYFAQTRIRLGSREYMLCMPIREESMRRVERFSALYKHLCCVAVARMEIFRDEMCYLSALGRPLRCDILLEPLPDALPLKDSIAQIASHEEAEQMLKSIDSLEQQLLNADISHNNIREDNLLINSFGTIFPIRWYYATAGAGADAEAFTALRERVVKLTANMPHKWVGSPDARCEAARDKYLYAGVMKEGLIAIESGEGWGYVDYNYREVIKPQYIWANDFCEGRAEVQTESGMGLIDKEGNYIIDPIYEAVEWEAEDGMARVCHQNSWALFDYSGRQLCDWGETFGGGL